MAKIVLIGILTLLVSYSQCEELQDYRVKAPCPNPQIPKNCTTGGVLCETCASLVVCIQNSDGTWDKINAQTCTSPQKCVNGECTLNADPYCDGTACLAFKCTHVGIFPDPFYCDRFVLCVKDGATLRPFLNQCEAGFGYNIKTGLCDVELVNNGQCEEGRYPVPLCESAGQTGALEDNPSMYYICEQYSTTYQVLYPVINVCPGGEVFEGFQCVDKDSVTTTADSTTVTEITTIS